VPRKFEDDATRLAQWIESGIGEPVHLAGNSMGGHIAIHIAARFPQLVRSLVLIDSTGVPFAISPLAHLKNFLIPRGFMSFLRILARDFFRTGPRAILGGLRRLLRDDARPLLRTLRMPVLLVWGARDPLVPLRYGKAMLAEVPHARLVVLDKGGHVPMWEDPAGFNRALLEFFGDVSPSAFAWDVAAVTGGIAHREAGSRRDAVLVHGLGMSSAYFGPLARALFDRGVHAIAPDLPGFGESDDAPALSMPEQAAALAGWADALAIRHAVWIGHSLGCNPVAHLAAMRPDLVREAVYVGPLWTQTPVRLLWALLRDAWREPPRLWPLIVRAYVRCGVRRWLGTFRHAIRDIESPPPSSGRMVAGERDPLPNRRAFERLELVPGAHACHFSHPGATADAVRRSAAPASPPAARR
jgi:pimeloyl-ACP methyl ester carboxylesterase